jgi:hypothetical protein
MSSSTADFPSSGMTIADPMISVQADHLVGVRDEAMRHIYTSGAGDWPAQQPQHSLSPPFSERRGHG